RRLLRRPRGATDFVTAALRPRRRTTGRRPSVTRSQENGAAVPRSVYAVTVPVVGEKGGACCARLNVPVVVAKAPVPAVTANERSRSTVTLKSRSRLAVTVPVAVPLTDPTFVAILNVPGPNGPGTPTPNCAHPS